MDRFDCTLWEYLKDYDIPMKIRINILKTLIDTVNFIQSKGFCHLDLKPSNIFLKLLEGYWDEKNLKIADFGLSRKKDDLSGRMGTPGFGSPEQFEGNPSMKSDNYALGRMAIFILFPWKLAWNLSAQLLTGKEFEEHWTRRSSKFQMISQLLNVSF